MQKKTSPKNAQIRPLSANNGKLKATRPRSAKVTSIASAEQRQAKLRAQIYSNGPQI